MYNPSDFRIGDPRVLGDVIDATVFATLVSNGPDGPRASHLPVLLTRAAGTLGMLRAHLARGNDHWRSLDGEPVLVMFQGPQHYVSPSWYPSKATTGKVVPTWNYVTVHVRGRARVHEDGARLRDLVGALTARMESTRDQPWAVEDAPADFVARMLGQIVGVEVDVEHLEGKFKLGQNRSAADRAGLDAGLAAELPETLAALRRLPAPEGDGGT